MTSAVHRRRSAIIPQDSDDSIIGEQYAAHEPHDYQVSYVIFRSAMQEKSVYSSLRCKKAWCSKEDIDLFRIMYQDTTMGDMIEDSEGLKLELKMMANVIFRNILAEAPYREKQFSIIGSYNETVEMLVDMQVPTEHFYSNLQLLVQVMPRDPAGINIKPIIRYLQQAFMRQLSLRNPMTLDGILKTLKQCMITIYNSDNEKLIMQTIDLNVAAALTKYVVKDSMFINHALDILSLMSVNTRVLDLFRHLKFQKTLLDLLQTRLNLTDNALLGCFSISLYTLENKFSVDDLRDLKNLVEYFYLQVESRGLKSKVIQDCWVLMGTTKPNTAFGRIIEVEKAKAHMIAVEPTREDSSIRLMSDRTRDPRMVLREDEATHHTGVVRALPPDCVRLDAQLDSIRKEGEKYAQIDDYKLDYELNSVNHIPPESLYIETLKMPVCKPIKGNLALVQVNLEDPLKLKLDCVDESTALIYLRHVYVSCMVEDIVGERMKKAGIDDDGRMVDADDEVRKREEEKIRLAAMPDPDNANYYHINKRLVSPKGTPAKQPMTFGMDSTFVNIEALNQQVHLDDDYYSTSQARVKTMKTTNVNIKDGNDSRSNKNKIIGHTHKDIIDYSTPTAYHDGRVNVFIQSRYTIIRTSA